MKKLLMLIAISSLGFAAPAYHGEIEFNQDDGSKFSGHLKGDEYFSWVEDKQGNIIKFNKVSKNYEYAKVKINQGKAELVPAGIKVNKKGALFSSSSSALGQSVAKEKLFEIWTRKKDEVKFGH